MDRVRAERLAGLFDQALDVEGTERRALCDAVRLEDAALADELDSLLAAHEAPGSLEALAARVLPRVLDDWSRSVIGIVPETTVGRYEVLGAIGRGGMGDVYQARDLALDRMVALKFLPPHLAGDDGARARLTREARAASALDHPNIAVVYEIGSSDPGSDGAVEARVFLAMAYYSGETIKQKVARGLLPIAEVIDYARQTAAGLAAAHEAGIVHRDIKPANLIVTARGQVKILDFGLATLAGSDMTPDGMTAGTVPYMSPEQTRGGPTDPRTDVWSFGVVLHEMLTGVRPFQGEDSAVLLQAIRHAQAPPLRRLRPDAPDALARLVTRCLSKLPEERYTNAGEVLADLRRMSETEAVAPAPWRLPRMVAATATVVIGAVLAVLLNAGAHLRTNPVAGPVTNTDAAVNPAAQDLYRRALAYAQVSEESNRSAYELLKRSTDLDETYAPAFSALGFRAYQLYAMGFAEAPRYLHEAEVAFERALSLDPQELHALSYQALLFIASGRPEEAIRPLRRALSIHPNAADAYISLGHVYRNAGLLDESARSFERAKVLDPTNRRLPSAGSVYHYLGRYDDALEAYTLEPYAPRTLLFQGLVLLESGRRDLARQRFESVVANGADGGPMYLLGAEALLAYMDDAHDRGIERVRELEQYAAAVGSDGEAPYAFARFYALFGERQGAVRMFERAVDLGFFAYPFIVADPFMTSVRDDLAFKKVLARARTRHEAFRVLVHAEKRLPR